LTQIFIDLLDFTEDLSQIICAYENGFIKTAYKALDINTVEIE